LWISDAGAPTGFGRVTHEIAERLVDNGHDISVLAVAYSAADPVQTNLKLYRADSGPTRSYLGLDRVLEVMQKVQPELVVTLEDIPMLMHRLFKNPFDQEQALARAVPIISYVPVDGYGLPPAWLKLKEHVHMVPMSGFGAEMLDIQGHIPHGVDTEMFHPISPEHPLETTAGLMTSKAQCREAFGIPQGDFVIGRVDTNSGRKDWGSTWRVIDAALRAGLDESTTLAAFHTKANVPSHGSDLNALVSRGKGRFMVTNADDWLTADVVAFINCFDITLSTSRGEGFGLGLAESLACGVPVLASDCSAITEVVGPGGVLVKPWARMTNPYGVDNMLADTSSMAAQLVMLSRNRERLQELGTAGRQHVIDSFNWDRAAAQFEITIAAVLSMQTEADT
jgi:glycosyltransferase involved in cell wall biosynthesis